MDVADIGTDDALRILGPIWLSKTATAAQVRARVERVLDWAIARQYRTAANPARWRGHLDTMLAGAAKVAPVTGQTRRHSPTIKFWGLNTFKVGFTRYPYTSPAFLPTHLQVRYRAHSKARYWARGERLPRWDSHPLKYAALPGRTVLGIPKNFPLRMRLPEEPSVRDNISDNAPYKKRNHSLAFSTKPGLIRIDINR
jgi:hypothetical protein